MSDEECFPRGRAPRPAPGTERKKKLEIDQPEKLFREAPKVVKENKKDRKRKNELDKAGWSKAEQKEIEEEESFKIKGIEFLQYKKIYDGMLILGCVKAIHELELVVSLPNCQTAYVKAHRISSVLTQLLQSQLESETQNDEHSLDKLFHVGQLLVGSVCDLRPEGKSIQLNLDPNVVNSNIVFTKIKPGMMLSGSVKSVEDHGFTIDVGRKGVKAFMTTSASDSSKSLVVGSVMRCTVLTAKSNGTILTLSNDPKRLNKMLAKPEHGITLDTIFPGTLVKFTPTQTLNEGTIGKFLDFQGSVTILNSQRVSQKNNSNEVKKTENNEVTEPPKLKKKKKDADDHINVSDDSLNNNQAQIACVLYITAGKHVALTTNPKVWRDDLRTDVLDLYQERYPVGHKCKVKVLTIVKGFLLLCQLDKNGPCGMIFQRNLSDEKSEADLMNMLSNKTLKARVTENLSVDGLLELSAKQSIMDATFFRYEDIMPGALVQAKIVEVQPKGFQVLLGSGEGKSFKSGGHLRGYISGIHFSDIILKHPEKRFNEGDVITCRVLTSDPHRRHLHLTHKPTLVNSKLPVITSYNQLEAGDIVHVFVASIKPSGCVVKMYNNVTGLVPTRELSAEFVESPEKTFFVGQVMKCRVLVCKPETQRLLLSFCLKPKKLEAKEVRDRTKSGGLTLGQMVKVEVTKRTDTGFEVKMVEPVQDGHRPFLLPTQHLSDFTTIASEMWNRVKIGSTLSDCVVIAMRPKPLVSRKPMLVENFKRRAEEGADGPLTFSDLEQGMTSPGFIHHVTEYGVFVEFGNGLTGLCPKSAMCDRYLADTREFFFVGQSVVAMVTNVDQEKRRFLVSLRPSECILEAPDSIISQFLRETELTSELSGGDSDSKPCLGRVVDIKMGAEGGERSYVITDDDLLDFSCELVDTQSEKCDDNKAVVISANMTSQHLVVTNVSNVVNERRAKDSDEHSVGSSLHCRVLHINDDVAVAYSTTTGHVVCLPTRLHYNDSIQSTERVFKEQQIVQVTVEKIKEGIVYGHVKVKAGVGKRIRQDSELSDIYPTDFTHQNIKVGLEVEGSVKSIRSTSALILINSLPMVKGRPLVGRLHVSEIMDDVEDDSNPITRIHVGETVKCHVIGCRDVKTHQFLEITRHVTRGVPELSMRRKEGVTSDGDVSVTQKYPLGKEVVAFVKNYDKHRHCFRVEIQPDVQASLPRLLASKQPDQVTKAESKFRHGRALHCVVVRNDGKNIVVSRKGLLVDCETKEEVQDVRKGCITNGEVRKVVKDGVLLRTELRSQGKVFMTDLSDEFEENPLDNYSVGQIVRCTVIGGGARDNLVLSLRKSAMREVTSPPVDPDVVAVKDLKPKQVLRGYVKSVSSAGIFVTLSRTCHGRVVFSRASKYFLPTVDKAKDLFTPGMLVTCSVVSLSPHEGRVELSLLQKDTGKEDVIPDTLDLPLRDGGKRKSSTEDVSPKKKKRKKEMKTVVSTKSNVEDLITKSEPEERKVKVKDAESQPPDVALVDPGFVWSDDVISKPKPRDSDDDSGIEDGAKVAAGKKKKRAAQEEEEETKRREMELLDQSHSPKSAAEWERLMVSNPQNSMLWVRYMAFHLHATEVDKARAVANKALKTISFREEEEKLNVWVALLNLENLYGSDVTVEETLNGAMQHNDQLKVLRHLVDIYVKSGKLDKSDEVYMKMSKKFRRNKDVWMSYLRYLMEAGRHEEAQDAFKRSLKSLEKKQHMELISKFGQLEYVFGDAERGRTMFENSLSTYPKRTDIWSVYIDTLVKARKYDEARDAFDRVTNLTISSKKMKSFFKRYVDFETRHGTDSAAALIRQRALDYINSDASRVMDD